MVKYPGVDQGAWEALRERAYAKHAKILLANTATGRDYAALESVERCDTCFRMCPHEAGGSPLDLKDRVENAVTQSWIDNPEDGPSLHLRQYAAHAVCIWQERDYHTIMAFVAD